MKRVKFAFLALVLVLAMCIPVLWAGAADNAVRFADPVLEAKVREQLGRPDGELTTEDVKNVENLNFGNEEGSTDRITSLDGLEAFESLFSLSAYNNDIEDVSPLSGLKRLQYLDLGGNRISDLSPLKDLNLVGVGLWGNQITDLRPLQEMTGMENLSLDGNHITDLTPLFRMSRLTQLTLGDNEISDISPLANLKNLQYLNLGANQISDLRPLKGLNLTELYIWWNQVSDLTPLKDMNSMERLDITNNPITDVAALSGMTNLKFLHLGGNGIADFGPVADIYDGIEDKDFELDERTLMLRRGENPDEVIAIDDPVLKEMLQKALGVSGDITIGAALGITELSLEMDGNDWSIPRITSLNGLQYFKNLRWLNLGWAFNGGETQVDLSPLAGLTKLDTLQLHCDSLNDISAIAGLTNMRNLWIWGNNIYDISMLAGMTQMEELWLFSNHVSDISIMAGMPNLWRVLMANNNVSDLSPLAGHTRLEALEIAGNPVWDYQAIAGIYPQLTQKDFDINDVPVFKKPENPGQVIAFADPVLEQRVRENLNKPEGDITAMDAAKLTRLELGTRWSEDLNIDMMIHNFDGLQYFINLKELTLYLNAACDLAPIAGLTDLEKLDISNNGLTDLSPIAGLTKLRELNFENNVVEDISALANMAELRVLKLQNNPIADYAPIQAVYGLLENKDFEYGQKFERYYKPENPDAVVTFPDPVLEQKIRKIVGKPEGDILSMDVAFMENLYLKEEWQEQYPEGTLISDLTGLEYFLNLKTLEMGHNTIHDLSPLAGLKKLELIDAMDLGLTDVSPLAGVTSLQFLDLSYNKITDVSPLTGLTSLHALHLTNNQIVDYSPLSGIYPNLEDRDFEMGDAYIQPENPDAVVKFTDPVLERRVREQMGILEGDITAGDAAKVGRLDFNMEWQENIPDDVRIHDLTGMEYFINLNELNLNFHAVSDIGVLAGLARLKSLDLGANGYGDLSIFASMPNLTRLVLFGNGIGDISPLRGLTKLTYLQLEHNQIADISALAGMAELRTLDVQDNRIADFSPLYGLENLETLRINQNAAQDVSGLADIAGRLQEKDFDPAQKLEQGEGSGSAMLQPENPDKVIVFADSVFEKRVRQELNMPEGDITAGMAAQVDTLNLGNEWQETFPKGSQFTKINGIQYFINLRSLTIAWNKVEDISKLAKLTRLEYLHAYGNRISDITPLAGLTNLVNLNIGGNKVKKIGALAGLVNLKELYLDGNSIKDYSPVRDLYPLLQHADFNLE